MLAVKPYTNILYIFLLEKKNTDVFSVYFLTFRFFLNFSVYITWRHQFRRQTVIIRTHYSVFHIIKASQVCRVYELFSAGAVLGDKGLWKGNNSDVTD